VRTFGEGLGKVLLLHGAESTGSTFVPLSRRLVARELTEAGGRGYRLLAPDLRGWGESGELSFPWVLEQHLEDLRSLGATVCQGYEGADGHSTEGGSLPFDMVVGHSMGAYIGLLLHNRWPELFPRVVLIDGGYCSPLWLEMGQSEHYELVLRPVLDWLDEFAGKSYSSLESFISACRDDPVFLGQWNEEIEQVLVREAVEEGTAWHRAVNYEACRETLLSFFYHREEIYEAGSGAFDGWLVRSGKGLNGEDPYISDTALVEWRGRATRMEVLDLVDESHETMLLAPDGAERLVELLATLLAVP